MGDGQTAGGGIDDPGRPDDGGEIIDVHLLVDDIRRRAAAMREGGAYPDHLLDAPFDLDGDDPLGAPLAAPITLRPERGYSSKPGVGPGITAVKRVAEKLVHHVVQDGLDQASIRIEHLSRALEDVERRTDERLDDLSRSLTAAEQRAGARMEDLREEVAELRSQVSAIGEAIARIDRRLDGLGGGRSSDG